MSLSFLLDPRHLCSSSQKRLGLAKTDGDIAENSCSSLLVDLAVLNGSFSWVNVSEIQTMVQVLVSESTSFWEFSVK